MAQNLDSQTQGAFVHGLQQLQHQSSLSKCISDYEASSSEGRDAIIENFVNETIVKESVKLHEILIEFFGHCSKENRYQVQLLFLEALLESSYARWTGVQLDFKTSIQETNPILLSLDNAARFPRAISHTQIAINYYIRLAKERKDLDVASPVLSSLSKIIELKRLHPDLVRKTLIGMSYFPVQNQSEIINKAVIAHPRSSLNFMPQKLLLWILPLKFLSRNLKKYWSSPLPLSGRQSSVFHVNSSENGGSGGIEQGFADDVFIASFDMLWHAPVAESKEAYAHQPKYLKYLYSILFRIRIRKHPGINSHAFDPEMLKNPAIEALINYKW
ncbi:hypothetical protein BGZ76_011720 [Entomortierella beljakovae]|nr:hypothetical protein BGZ76_011720 [Entomortierella beljakovae]